LTIENCTVYNEGGFVESGGFTILRDTILYPNVSYQGGRIQAYPLGSRENASYIIENCHIIGKEDIAADNIFPTIILGSSPPNRSKIRNSTFLETPCLFSNCEILESIFTGNCNESEILQIGDNSTILNSTIVNINALGDALELLHGTANITNTTITGGRIGAKIGFTTTTASLNLLNSTLDSHVLGNNACHLRRSNFLNVDVVGESSNLGLPNISLSLYDKNNNNVFNGRTSDRGQYWYVPVLWNDSTKNLDVISTPHRLVIQKDNVTNTVEHIDMSRMQNITILFDDIPPILNISHPADGLVINSSVIEIQGSTDTDARVTLNNQLINNVNGVISQSWWLDEGNNTLVFRAQDPAGNIAEVVRNVTLKTIGPSIRISEPKDGAVTNQNPIVIKGFTNGTRAEIDGKPVLIEQDGSFSLNYSFSGEGQRTIFATAWDEVNNTGFARVRVEYDITPPSIDIVSPMDGSRTNLASTEVRGTITGASNATINGQDLQIGSGGAFSETIRLGEGLNEILIRARDIAGNTNAATCRVFLDTTIQLNITSPADGVQVNSSSIVITGRTDSDAVITIGDLSVKNLAGNFSQAVPLAEGLNKVTVSSVDLAGNRIEKTVRITVDTIPPVITVISPLENTVMVQNLEMRIRSEAGAVVTVDGVQVNGTGDLFTFTGILQKGANKFTITARDAAGNTNTTEKTLTYVPAKKAEPPVTTDNGLLWPMLAIVVVAVLAIIGYFYLRKKPDGTPPPPPENPV
jgi:hypothetical protein